MFYKVIKTYRLVIQLQFNHTLAPFLIQPTTKTFHMVAAPFVCSFVLEW